MLILEKHPFHKLHNKKRLAWILNTDADYFKTIDEQYKVYPFKKFVGRKKRDLFNTDKKYKAILKKINRILIQSGAPDYVYGGIPKKDFLDNAIAHSKNSYVQNADIKNFFPSTNDSYVYGLFRNKFKTSPDIAKILTLLTTYPDRNGKRHIPQGFPTSTILSFLAYFDLFNGINHLCKINNIHFTLFVDDMTFSSQEKIPKSFLNHISAIVSKYNLELHPDKVRRTPPYKPKNITGVIIETLNQSLKAPNKLQEKLYDTFKRVHNYSINNFNDYIHFKRLVLKLDGQLKSIKRIEMNRHTPFIDKVLKDIKINFIHPTVKGAPYASLKEEFKTFYKLYSQNASYLECGSTEGKKLLTVKDNISLSNTNLPTD